MDQRIAYIELAGVTLSGHKRPDQGLYWTTLDGWWGLPDLRGGGDSLPGGHGNFRRNNRYRDARVLKLTGHILAASNRDLVAVRDRIESAWADGAGQMKVVTAETGIWLRDVEIDTLTIDPDHGRRSTKFIVDMVAPDPRRYGPSQLVGPVGLPVSTGGVRLPQRFPWNFGEVSGDARMQVLNSGAIDMQPRFIIEGGGSAVTVVDITTGRRLRLPYTVPAGATLIFDSERRRATLDGQDVTRWMTSRNWFNLKPGEVHEFRIEVQGQVGTPQMWAEYRIGAW